MCGCANKSDSQNKVQDTAKPMAAQSFTGVITSVDKELKQLSVREIDTDVDTIINYDDTAEIKDKMPWQSRRLTYKNSGKCQNSTSFIMKS